LSKFYQIETIKYFAEVECCKDYAELFSKSADAIMIVYKFE